MTNSDSDELSPSDWNYRHDERIKPSKIEAIASLSSIGLGIILSFFFSFSGEPFLGLVVLVIGIGLPMILTEKGRRGLNDMKRKYNEEKTGSSSQQQQEQQTSRSKQICGDCGWQNPRNNNYCNDCGEELSSKI